jgi:hypothetical protein
MIQRWRPHRLPLPGGTRRTCVPPDQPVAWRGRRSAGPAPVGVLAGLTMVAMLAVGGCTRAKDGLPTAAITPSASEVAAPSLPSRSPAPCTTTPPDVPPTSPAPQVHPIDEAVADRAQQYLDAHPDDAGILIEGDGRLYAGFVSGWCQYRLALQQIVGNRVGIEVFAVAQSYQAARRLMDEIWAAQPELRQAGIELAMVKVDGPTGLTSVTTPDDPSKARAVILRHLRLAAYAPIMVVRGGLLTAA